MVDLNIEIPEGFLNEEVRCGYTITKEMKGVWAVQLDLLEQMKKVCKRHGLRYYGDSGTLIGAVRHQGYIPWDDDIDIVMFRDDYNKFIEYGKDEISDPYFLQTVYSDTGLMRAHAQLRNTNTTGFMPQEKKREYNRGIFIDIFPLDNLPDNNLKLSVFSFMIKQKWRMLTNYTDYNFREKTLKSKIFHHLIAVPLIEKKGYKEAYRKYENYCSKYNKKKCKRISYIAYSFGKNKHIWNTEWFNSCYEVPYEFTFINIPCGFDERLRKEYGDYMIVKNVPSSHGTLILDANKSYKYY